MWRFALTSIVAIACFGTPALAAGGDKETGHRLAVERCSTCHAVESDVTAADKVDPLVTIAKDPRMTSDRLRGFLTKPHGGMPDFSLSQREIADLIAYMESLR
ncbi:MAG: c-type cytochrome [Rhodospirillales bacterium]|nr:c-type cytochrome [Rhodospirillales bacterium]